MMNLLHLSAYYTPAYAFGGVVRSVEGMTRALARRGHRVVVLTTDALDQATRYEGPSREVLHGVEVIRVRNVSPALRGRYNLSTPQKLRKIAQEIMPEMDLLHCHEFRTLENLIVTPIAAKAGKPITLSPHGTLDQSTGRGGLKSAWDHLLSPAVAQRIDHCIGLTVDEVTSAQALWPQFGRRQVETLFSVVPNGVDPAEYANLPDGRAFREQWRLGDGPVCLFMGRLHPRKGPELLTRAFLAANIPNAKLVIAGPDEGALSAILPLADERIVITGYLDGDARLAALSAADCFALPAIGEGLPMAVLEALAAGLPVVISAECHLPEVRKQGAGLEVPVTVEAVSEALRTILTDAPLRQKMAQAAQSLIHSHFTWDAVAQQLEAVYQQTLG